MWADKETPEPRGNGEEMFKCLYARIKRDADEVNAFLNFHRKCKAGSCTKGLKYNTCRFGILMRVKLKSGVTQLMIDPETGKVVAKPTSDNQKLTSVNPEWHL